MKIGTMLYFHSLEETEKSFIRLREFGFTSCQINSWEPQKWTNENADSIRALAQKHGIEISSFWCGWEGPTVWNFYEGQKTLGLVPPEYRAMRVQNLCDGADFAHRIGLTDVATHMGFIPENPYDPNFEPLCDAIRTVAQHLMKNGQYLLFETGQETPVTMLRCFEQVGTDNLAVNLDTANLILYGKVDFHALLRKLKELGYDSWVTIEREISGEQQEEDIRYAKAYAVSAPRTFPAGSRWRTPSGWPCAISARSRWSRTLASATMQA